MLSRRSNATRGPDPDLAAQASHGCYAGEGGASSTHKIFRALTTRFLIRLTACPLATCRIIPLGQARARQRQNPCGSGLGSNRRKAGSVWLPPPLARWPAGPITRPIADSRRWTANGEPIKWGLSCLELPEIVSCRLQMEKGPLFCTRLRSELEQTSPACLPVQQNSKWQTTQSRARSPPLVLFRRSRVEELLGFVRSPRCLLTMRRKATRKL